MRWKWIFISLFLLVSGVSVWLLWAYSGRDRLPPILFLNWDGADRVQLFKISIGDNEPTQLTQSDDDILNFAISPDGRKIVYSTGPDLWLLTGNGRTSQHLLPCHEAKCDQIVWHPDGRRLLYERQEPESSPRLWWLDTESGETIPLQPEAPGPSEAARFSADGEWVSYVVSPEQGLEFYNFADGRHFQLPTSLGTPAIWHPSRPVFLYRNQQIITFHGSDDNDHQGHSHNFSYAMPLLLANAEKDGRSPTIISDREFTDDASAAWSPDGQWIVFGRRLPGTSNGRQLWLVRADGSESHALTDEFTTHHGIPSWSGDGRYILYQRYDTSHPESRPGIWLLEVKTKVAREIIPTGFQPAWK